MRKRYEPEEWVEDERQRLANLSEYSGDGTLPPSELRSTYAGDSWEGLGPERTEDDPPA